MTTDMATRTDAVVQADVQDELEWTADVRAPRIGVAVNGGAVTLSGEVEDNSERLAAMDAARRVKGVSTVVDALTIHPRAMFPVTETDIAKEVDRALKAAANVPETVKAAISRHDITLTGEVQWDYQRESAKRAVEHLRGVHSVEDRITLAARVSVADTEERIKNALARNALLDAKNITVTVEGTKVILSGFVRSWMEKDQARRAAWHSPHATDVECRIVILPH